MKGKLVLIVAPSGTGKSTIIKRLLRSWLMSTNRFHLRLVQLGEGKLMGLIIILLKKKNLKKEF